MSSQNDRQKKEAPNAFLRYSSMAFTMAAAIGIFVYAGVKLDEWQKNDFPAWTVTGSVIGVFAAMYYVIKDLLKK